jgi:hypothetical protein
VDERVVSQYCQYCDDICMIKTMNTEAINHDPALTFMQTGAQQGNRPSMGAWVLWSWE